MDGKRRHQHEDQAQESESGSAESIQANDKPATTGDKATDSSGYRGVIKREARGRIRRPRTEIARRCRRHLDEGRGDDQTIANRERRPLIGPTFLEIAHRGDECHAEG